MWIEKGYEEWIRGRVGLISGAQVLHKSVACIRFPVESRDPNETNITGTTQPQSGDSDDTAKPTSTTQVAHDTAAPPTTAATRGTQGTTTTPPAATKTATQGARETVEHEDVTTEFAKGAADTAKHDDITATAA